MLWSLSANGAYECFISRFSSNVQLIQQEYKIVLISDQARLSHGHFQKTPYVVLK